MFCIRFAYKVGRSDWLIMTLKKGSLSSVLRHVARLIFLSSNLPWMRRHKILHFSRTFPTTKMQSETMEAILYSHRYDWFAKTFQDSGYRPKSLLVRIKRHRIRKMRTSGSHFCLSRTYNKCSRRVCRSSQSIDPFQAWRHITWLCKLEDKLQFV